MSDYSASRKQTLVHMRSPLRGNPWLPPFPKCPSLFLILFSLLVRWWLCLFGLLLLLLLLLFWGEINQHQLHFQIPTFDQVTRQHMPFKLWSKKLPVWKSDHVSCHRFYLLILLSSKCALYQSEPTRLTTFVQNLRCWPWRPRLGAHITNNAGSLHGALPRNLNVGLWGLNQINWGRG